MKKSQSITKQLIATTFLVMFLGVYMLDFTCTLRIIRLAQPPGVASSSHHAHHGDDKHPHTHTTKHQHTHTHSAKASNHAGHDAELAHKRMPTAPQASSCCKDQTATFFASLSTHKVSVLKVELKKLEAIQLTSFFRIFSGETWSLTRVHLGLHRQQLKPKIPDRRIFFCSLTI